MDSTQIQSNKIIEYQHSNDDSKELDCDENTLVLLKKFNKLYEERLQNIIKETGFGNIELEYPVYKEWVQDLILQNTSIVQTVIELEKEACYRSKLLESKFNKNNLNYNYDNECQKLRADIKNLLELIRRARDDQNWDVNGLSFHYVTTEEILGNNSDLFPSLGKNGTHSPHNLNEDFSMKEFQIEKLKSIIEINKMELSNNKKKLQKLLDNEKCLIEDSKNLKLIIMEQNERLLKFEKSAGKNQEMAENVISPYTLDEKISDKIALKLKDSSHTDFAKLNENDTDAVYRLRNEIEQLVAQIRNRESHVLHQNNIILDYQKKLLDSDTKLKSIIGEKENIMNILMVLEIEIHKLEKYVKNIVPELYENSIKSPDSVDDQYNKNILILSTVSSVLIKLLNKQLELDINSKEKLHLSNPGTSKETTEMNNKEYFDQQVEEKLNKHKMNMEMVMKQFFQELFKIMGIEPNDIEMRMDDIKNLMNGDSVAMQNLMCDLKENLETKFQSTDENNLKHYQEIICAKNLELKKLEGMLNILENDKEYLLKNENKLKYIIQKEKETVQDLIEKKQILEEELITLKDRITTKDDKTKDIIEARNKLEIENKNLLTTISNLRKALELTKRGQPTNVSDNQQSSSLWGWWRNVHDV